METFQRFSDWFWAESFWLPAPVTWRDLQSNDNGKLRMPHTNDLLAVVPITVLIIFLRVFFERFIALSLLKWCGLKERAVQKVEPNEILEKVYGNLTGQLEGKEVTTLASRLEWTVKRVEQWFRNRRCHSKPSKMKKSKECCWRCFFYTGTSLWGSFFLIKEPYLYDTKHFWVGYPHHHLSDGIYYYYVVQTAFYFSLLLFQFADVKRKDFWIQTIHHVVTVALLVFSYSCNFVRIGAVILLVHDVSDIILEFGKVCKYLKLHKASGIVFGVFATVFFVSRLIIFPFWILRSACLELPIIFKTTMPMYYCFLVLLFTLQAMHLFWFYLISRMAYDFLVSGKIDNDARSETEDSGSDVGETNGNVINGVINSKPKTQ